MIRFQADADIQHRIVLSVRRREPAIDFASAVDGGLAGIPDSQVLELAATQGRILITHDRRTMLEHFRNRLEAGKSSPDVFLMSQFEPLASIVDSLVMVWAASDADEWRDQVRHLPTLSRHVFPR